MSAHYIVDAWAGPKPGHPSFKDRVKDIPDLEEALRVMAHFLRKWTADEWAGAMILKRHAREPDVYETLLQVKRHPGGHSWKIVRMGGVGL